MDWLEDVRGRLKRKNQILFSKESTLLQDLMGLMDGQKHQALVLWALELAQGAVETLEEKYPREARPRAALEATRLWASGAVKMPIAKREILRCHAFAKEISAPEDIALCHGVGQACGVVHAKGHAMGFPIYELTAMVYQLGAHNCRGPIETRKGEYRDRLVYWSEHYREHPGPWAGFLCKD